MTASYPSSIVAVGQNDFHNTNNLGSSSLGSTITSGATTLTVNDATTYTTWPTASFVINIETELIFVGSRTGNTLSSLVRGFGGTSAASHTTGKTVEVVLSSNFIQRLSEEIIALETQLGTGVTAKGIKSATTDVNTSAATAPTTGQVLTATSSTTATWQTPTVASPDFPDTTFRVSDDGDNTKKLAFEVSGVSTGTTRTATVPNENFTMIGRATTDTGANRLQNKDLDNSNVFHVNAADTTKKIGFQTSGAATSTTTTVASVATTNRTVTLPDATDTLVGKATTDTLTNKTLTSSTNVLGGVTLTLGSDAANDLYYRNGSGVLTRLANGTTGQVLTATTSSPPSWATPSSGGITFTEVTGTSQSAAVNSGYLLNNSSLVTVTLPSTASVGQIVALQGSGAGGWRLAQNSGQKVIWNAGGVAGTNETTSGTGGRIDSTDRYDSLYVMCITANTTWVAHISKGNPSLT